MVRAFACLLCLPGGQVRGGASGERTQEGFAVELGDDQLEGHLTRPVLERTEGHGDRRLPAGRYGSWNTVEVVGFV